jgi:crotonobetainyl-CoA:carnitine CoA-transferase CaiB-like acyl-CoA transferase
MSGPLAGIRVFDLTIAMAGPWATLNLAGLGADVIHIDRDGEDTIGSSEKGRTTHGMESLYIACSTSKRSIFLDLKSEQGQLLAQRLLAASDVFVINMRPGVASRLGVDYEAVSRLNPRIVYCSLTGWGETGPMSPIQGAEPQIQYVSGYGSITGVEGGPPEVCRQFATLDANTGNHAALAVIMALVARERTGKGQLIEINMLHSAMALQTSRLGPYLRDRVTPGPLGNAAASTAPDEVFRCRDGRDLGVSVTSEQEWARFCEAIGRPGLASEPGFASAAARVRHRDRLREVLTPVFAGMPREYWTLQFRRHRIACGYPMWFSDLRYHAQVTANDYLPEIETPWGRVVTGGTPWQFSATPVAWGPPPVPGSDTSAVIDDLEGLPGTTATGARTK